MKLILIGMLVLTIKGERLELPPGTEIDLDENEYGLTEKDLERIIRSGNGRLEAEASGATEELVEAIGLLEPGNETHWTAGGVPEVSALKKLVDRKVTAGERDAAWAIFQEQNNLNG